MGTIEIHPAAPYNFSLALDYLRNSPSAVAESVPVGGGYRRALTIDGHDIVLSLESIGTVSNPALIFEIIGAESRPNLTDRCVRLIRRLFSLDDEQAPFLRVAAHDPVFAGVLRAFPDLRPVLIASPYEALIWAIIGQQINVTFARTLKLALIDLAGRTLETDIGTFLLTPDPERVAALDPRQLRERQYSRQKIEYVLAVTRAVASGELDLEGLRQLPHDQALQTLMAYRGVGRWTAEYVLMRGLGAQDIIPAGDLGLRAIIGRWYGLERTATEEEVREIAEPWAPYRGWASFYWWMALQAHLPVIDSAAQPTPRIPMRA